MKSPLFILVEGIDGSGKSTLCDNLCAKMKDAGVDVVKLREPTDGSFGKEIRRRLASSEHLSPDEMLNLFIEDRQEDCDLNISPALSAGKTIVMDRYYYSNAAYQGAMGLNPDAIIRANRARNFPEPDIILLADIDPETSLERVKSRGAAAEQFEKTAFLSRVREI